MDDVLYFDYMRVTLGRWLSHFRTLIEQLEQGPFIPKLGSVTGDSRIISNTIIRDLKHLGSEAIVITGLCESCKSTVISSFSVFLSSRICCRIETGHTANQGDQSNHFCISAGLFCRICVWHELRAIRPRASRYITVGSSHTPTAHGLCIVQRVH
jgi:hypothetical protein